MKTSRNIAAKGDKVFIEMTVEGVRFEIKASQPIEIAIPLDFDGRQPNVHGIGKASSKVHIGENFTGDVNLGGSCNWRQYTLTPHSHGTHTESIGHITKGSFPIHAICQELLIPTTLISVEAAFGKKTSDTYFPDKQATDQLITYSALVEKLDRIPDCFCQGLVIKTLPNDSLKMVRDYQKQPAPYFSREAMEYLVERKVKHLLVDFPSIDRMHDGGHMLNHHLFWKIPLGTHTPDAKSAVDKTITEMIYVPEEVADGPYALNLQIPSFIADAAPSRPILFPLIKTTSQL